LANSYRTPGAQGAEERRLSPFFNATVCVFAILTIVSFLFLFFSTHSFIVNFRDVGLSFFSGMRNGVHKAASVASGTVLAVQELAVLREEYAELTSRMARYEQIERSAAEIQMENQRLREQLDFAQATAYKGIASEIIGKDPDNLFSALVINKGTHNGISVNMPVIAYQDGTQGLVGKVIQAGKFESLIMPLYDASCFVAARLSSSRHEGIVGGQGTQDAPLLMRFIQKWARSELNLGDVIISSGMGGVYPVGVTVGRVSKIQSQEYELSMEVELVPAIDFSRLEYVFVINEDKGEGTGD
jgi:rod shape-determining protein MreC